MNAEPESNTRLRGRRFAWLMWVLTSSVALLTLLFVFLNRSTSFPVLFCCAGVSAILIVSFIVTSITVGALIASRRAGNPIGWIFCSASLLISLWLFAYHYAIYTSLTYPNSLPGGAMMAWIAQWLWLPGWGLIALLFLLFPNGHLPSRRWWLVAAFLTGSWVVTMICLAFLPGQLEWSVGVYKNPFGVNGVLGTALGKLLSVSYLFSYLSFLASALSLIYRFYKAVGIERQQIKWIAYAGAVFGMAFLFSVTFYGAAFWGEPGVRVLFLAVNGFPLSVGIAILKYRLYNIDLLINRTLVYGALTALVVGLYILIVGAFGTLLQTQNNLPGIVIALSLIAFLFQPLRRRLQDIVNHFVPVSRAIISQSIATPAPQTKQEQKAAATDGVPNTALRGHWLLIARLVWVAGFITLTTIYALGFQAVREILSTVCEEEPCTLRQQIRHTDAGDQIVDYGGPPIGYADPLHPYQVEALEALGLTLDQYGWLAALQMGIPVLVYLLIAAGLFWRKSDDRMVLFVSIMVATFPLQDMPLPFTLTVNQPAWEWIHTPATALALSCFLIFPLIFPTGRFVPRWTRWMALFEIAGAAMAILFQNYILEVRGGQLILFFLLISFGTGVYAQLYRYFRVASPVERQQLKWVIVGLAGFVSTGVAVLLPLDALLISQAGSMDPARALVLSFIPDMLFRVISLFIPVSIAISVLRYRLWDIDLIISRTLVYGALTASVVGLYVLIVGGLGALLQTQNNLPGIVIAILLIAFLFQPLRRRLQDLVNHFVPVPQATDSQSIATPVPQTKQAQKVAVTDSAPSTALRGRWLIFARLAWAAGFTVLTAMYALGFLAVREALSTVCEEELCTLRQQIQHTDAGDKIVSWPGPPVGYADRLRPGQVEALQTLGLTLDRYSWLGALQMGIPALVLLLIAAGLFWRKSDDWMVLFASAMVATFPLHNTPLPFTLMVHQPAWEWVYHSAGMVALSCLMIFPLIFPTGRFVPRWTRWLALYEVAGAVIAAFLGNAILEVFGDFLGRAFIGVAFLLPTFGTGVFAQLHRYFRVARPAERQQFKWVVVGLVGFVITQLAVLIPLNALLTSPAVSADPAWALVLSAIPDTLWQVNNLFIAVTITISVLRYRLWDIDIFINRSLVYGALIVSVIGLYMIGVGVASVLFQSVGNTLLAILATGLIAVLFHPLRQRLQSAINHLMYGERDDPYVALARLGRRLEASLAPEAVLPTVVTTVRETLKLPYVAIYLQQDSHGYKIVAEAASPSLRMQGGRIRVPGMEREGRCIPLIHQGETLGYIVLGPRAPNEAFSSTDLHLLKDLAPQVGVAVHAVRLTADLQRSRERLVVAREEERRRLRRDLHDGLGPQLAGIALKLETLRNRLTGDPLADSFLADLAKRTQEATADIRHLVYELRPPTLDELGLVMALREGAAQYTQQGCNDLNITFDAPESLPPLPAAVEVAVYRITQEALLNVMRHADASNCLIRLSLDEPAGLLCLEVRDDGKGLPMKRRAGVGLNSMHERAEELGGTLTITPIPTGGTSLIARLPCRLIELAGPVEQDPLDVSDEEL